MVEDHFSGLVEPTNLLQGLLRPLLEVLSDRGAANAVLPDGSALETPANAAAKADSETPDSVLTPGARLPVYPWQSASLEIFAVVQKADRMIKGLLTNTDTPMSAEQVVPELREAFSEQQQKLHNYQMSVKQASKTVDP